MHTGMILLVWLGMAVVLIVGLVASGMLTIKIEMIDPDEENSDDGLDEE